MRSELRGVFPEVLFHIGPISVRDTVVYTWVVMLLLTIIALITSRWLRLYPGLWQEFIETGITSILELLQSMVGNGASRYIPLIGTLAFFILVSNAIEIVPGLKPPTKDINTTAALAIIVFLSVHYYGIKSLGFIGYLKQLSQPIFILLPLNLLAHLTRTISLAVRLFGNIMSGEFVIAILVLLVPLLVPVPIMLFELFIGAIQAFIFVILAISYISGGIKSGESG